MYTEDFQDVLMKNYNDQLKNIVKQCTHLSNFGKFNDQEIIPMLSELVSGARADGLQDDNIKILLLSPKMGLEQYFSTLFEESITKKAA